MKRLERLRENQRRCRAKKKAKLAANIADVIDNTENSNQDQSNTTGKNSDNSSNEQQTAQEVVQAMAERAQQRQECMLAEKEKKKEEVFASLDQFQQHDMLFKQSVKEFNSRCAKYKHTMCNICRITRMDFEGTSVHNYPVCNDCQNRFSKWHSSNFCHFKYEGKRTFMTKMEEFRIYFAKNLPV